MIRSTRRLVAAVTAVAALGGLAAATTTATAATHTQRLDVAARLLKQPPGKPWEVDLLLGAELGMDDGSVPEPVNNIFFEFTNGAKVNSDAFKTCSEATLRQQGPSACPAGSLLGSGTAKAQALSLLLNADLKVFNGPGTVNKRTLYVYAQVREINSVRLIFPGTLTKSSGKYGWKLDLPIPPIEPLADQFASITEFAVDVGGYGKKKGRKGKVPFIEAPTKCTKPGWPFAATFKYADGASARATALMDCTIRALPGLG